MKFKGMPVPSANWVKIENITEKNGSPLPENNWRKERIGRISLCWIAGGFQERSAFFKGKILMANNEVTMVDFDSYGWCSTSTAYPKEIESGIFEFETNTSIYHFRLLSEAEVQAISNALNNLLKEQLERNLKIFSEASIAQSAVGKNIPVS